MYSYIISICQWLWTLSNQALENAYIATKKVRQIQSDYIYYRSQIPSKTSWYNVSLYINSILTQCSFEIYYNLFKFNITKYFLHKLLIFAHQNQHNLNKDVNTNNLIIDDLTSYFNTSSSNEVSFDNFNFEGNSNNDQSIQSVNTIGNLVQLSNLFSRQHLNLNQIRVSTNWNKLKRKLTWIEATLIDLKNLQIQSDEFVMPNIQENKTQYNVSKINTPIIAYEDVGLVPRSITRTFSRFKIELEGQSASLVLPEFRLAKYQAVASLQYMACLFLIPWIVSTACKTLVLEPLITYYWNTTQSQIFINVSQEEKALKRLQQIEELLWLDIVINDNLQKSSQDQSIYIHNKTIELVNKYNNDSIENILHLFVDLLSLTTIALILTWGKTRLAILSSWIQELFYSLSDTMKAFIILLLTDLCIGFHSPHGWEIFIDTLLEHFGFSHNKHVISCFVSTFPVILDTVFKYWIFRHLNRISPSIVVTYHSMNE